jgi:ATP-dependent protease HslVU (ClpYQ) peptidase subunit
MSTLVGIVDGKNVYLGADSLASTEDGDVRPIKCRKIFKNGPYLIGFIGSVRGGQVLYPEYFTPPKKVEQLPDAIIAQSAEKGCLITSEQSTSLHACNFLIGFKGKLYEILVDFQINEIESYTSVGSGSYYAFGSLHTTEQMKDDFTPEMRIELALEAAQAFSTSTQGPFYVVKM